MQTHTHTTMNEDGCFAHPWHIRCFDNRFESSSAYWMKLFSGDQQLLCTYLLCLINPLDLLFSDLLYIYLHILSICCLYVFYMLISYLAYITERTISKEHILIQTNKWVHNHLFLRDDKMDGNLQKMKKYFYVLSSFPISVPLTHFPLCRRISFPSHIVSVTKVAEVQVKVKSVPSEK